MNMDEVWIGDEVIIKSSGVRGWFQGKGSTDLYKVKSIDGMMLEAIAEDIVLAGPSGTSTKSSKSNQSAENEEKPSTKKSDILNLEYDALKKNFPRLHDRLLDYQLEVCEEFIQSIIARKKTYCKIIYGLGDPVLKSSVATLIRKFPEVSIYTPHPDQDSWEVWFDDESQVKG